MNGRTRELLTALAVTDMDESPPVLSAGPLDDSEWARLVAGVRDERLGGLLARAIDTGLLPATEGQRRTAYDAAVTSAALALRLERKLLQITDLLERHKITYRVLKGPALAHTLYEDPSLREFGDVDLLIGSREWDATVALLADHGHPRLLGEVRPGFDRRFGKEATVVGDDRLEVDLHRTLVIGPFGLTVDLPSLFASPGEMRLGGRVLPMLGSEARFLHACYAAAITDDPPHLNAQRDLARIVLRTPPDVGPVLARARSWRAEAVVARALMLTWETLSLREGGPLLEWARNYRPSAVDRWLLASYVGAGRSYRSQAAAVLVIPGLRDKCAYLRALALPSREYRDLRGVTPRSYWRRSLGRLRRSRAA